MRIVIAPDAFKGSLSQTKVAETMKEAIDGIFPMANCVLKPMADGGEGTLEACMLGRKDLHMHVMSVTGPRGEAQQASIGITDDGVAIIEMATIAGLELVPIDQRNPSNMTTYGVGEAIVYALDQGAHEIIVGLGGSVTNDGGIGLLQALGATIEGTNSDILEPLTGKDLSFIDKVDISTVDQRISQTRIRIASDVTNPLCGAEGATFIFAPQKGARPEELSAMDKHMKKYVQAIYGSLISPFETAIMQGAGAAGGLGFALLLLQGTMEQGAKVVGDIIQLDEAIQKADLVITGEGKTDLQTLRGKAPFYVAARGKHFSVPVMLISGKIEDMVGLDSYFSESYTLVSDEVSSAQAIKDAKRVLKKTLYTIFRRMLK